MNGIEDNVQPSINKDANPFGVGKEIIIFRHPFGESGLAGKSAGAFKEDETSVINSQIKDLNDVFRLAETADFRFHTF